MAKTIETLKIKTVEQVRDDYLRTYKNSLIQRGVSSPNTSDGTEIYQRATSLAQQVYIASENVPLAANAQMADSSEGDDLVRVASIYKLALRPAGGSAGDLVLAASIITPVILPQGAQLIDPSGLSYEVSVGGSYTPGGNVPVDSIDTGDATNLAEGTVLRWVSPPPFVSPTALVSDGGLTGGVDAEDYEGLRSRLLQRLQSPPNGVNWPSVAETTENASTAVQKAFVYQAANGPSTCHVAVTRAPTATNKGRTIDSLVLSTVVVPEVYSAFPEFVEIVTTGTQDYAAPVSFGLALPASRKAVPAGPGGGWFDAAPFPYRSALQYSPASAVTSTTGFTTISDVRPVVGGQICWLSTDDWILRTAKILSFSQAPPFYTLVIDTPFVSLNGVSVANGDFIFPNAERMSVYVKAVLDGFGKMGPGEKTTNPSLIPRASRRPLPSISWPSQLQKPFLRALSDAGDEVYDVQYLFLPIDSAPQPGSIGGPPYILVPSQIGFYPI